MIDKPVLRRWTGAVACVIWHACAIADATLPTPRELDLILPAIWEKQERRLAAFTRNGWGKASMCIPLPTGIEPDARSHRHEVMQWHADYLLDLRVTETRKQHLQKLEALVEAGLLERSPVSIVSKRGSGLGNRYRMTEFAWALTEYQAKQPCFKVGETGFLGVSSVDRLEPDRAGRERILVEARIGFRNADAMLPWTRFAAIKQAFPELNTILQGSAVRGILTRSQQTWTEDPAQTEPEPRPNPTPLPSPADIERLREHVLSTYERRAGDDLTWPPACAHLPGANSKLPVDVEYFGRGTADYIVAIQPDKPRSPVDNTLTLTVPHLKMLEEVGVVRPGRFPEGYAHPKADIRSPNIRVYTLTPRYMRHLHKHRQGCLFLGTPRARMVSFEVKARPAQVRFRLSLTYQEALEWTRESTLRSRWEDVRLAIDRGWACWGEFDYDPVALTTGSGAGSCVWAFDSPTAE